MNYVTILCPHCGKELQIPDDADRIVCMYCAQPINALRLLHPDTSLYPETYEELLDEARAMLVPEVYQRTLDRTQFKATSYPKYFEDYAKLFFPVLNKLVEAATAGDTQNAADRFSDFLIDGFAAEIERQGIKKESDIKFFDIRFMIVSLTVPAMIKHDSEVAELAAESFLEKWNAKYTKNKLGKSTYESICKGFKTKLCFITTATCSSLGKGDDCYELNAFRKFRDSWLAESENGAAKISEYYLFAPMVVRAIDCSSHPEAVYRSIWETYLSPCLYAIETGCMEDCAVRYENMMNDLEQKWLC